MSRRARTATIICLALCACQEPDDSERAAETDDLASCPPPDASTNDEAREGPDPLAGPSIDHPLCDPQPPSFDVANWPLHSEPSLVWFYGEDEDGHHRLQVLAGGGLVRSIPERVRSDERLARAWAAAGTDGVAFLAADGRRVIAFADGGGLGGAALIASELEALLAGSGLERIFRVRVGHAHGVDNGLAAQLRRDGVPPDRIEASEALREWSDPLRTLLAEPASTVNARSPGGTSTTDPGFGSVERRRWRLPDGTDLLALSRMRAGRSSPTTELTNLTLPTSEVEVAAALARLAQSGDLVRVALLGRGEGRSLAAISQAMGDPGALEAFLGPSAPSALEVVARSDDPAALRALLGTRGLEDPSLRVVISQQDLGLAGPLRELGYDVIVRERADARRALYLDAEAARRMNDERSRQLELRFREEMRRGPLLRQVLDRAILGAGTAGTLHYATLPRSDPALEGALPGTLVIAAGRGLFDDLTSRRLGQPPRDLSAPARSIQPAALQPDPGHFLASALVAADELLAHQSRMPILQREIEEVRQLPSGLWRVTLANQGDALLPVELRSIDARAVDVTLGLGPSRALLDAPTTARLQEAGRYTSFQDQPALPRDDVRTVAVAGSGGTGAWAAQAALEREAERVFWLGSAARPGDRAPPEVEARMRGPLARYGGRADQFIAAFHRAFAFETNDGVLQAIADGRVELMLGRLKTAELVCTRDGREQVRVQLEGTNPLPLLVDGVVSAAGQELPLPRGLDYLRYRGQWVDTPAGRRLVALEAVSPSGAPLGARLLGSLVAHPGLQSGTPPGAERLVDAQAVLRAVSRQAMDPTVPEQSRTPNSLQQATVNILLANGASEPRGRALPSPGPHVLPATVGGAEARARASEPVTVLRLVERPEAREELARFYGRNEVDQLRVAAARDARRSRELHRTLVEARLGAGQNSALIAETIRNLNAPTELDRLLRRPIGIAVRALPAILEGGPGSGVVLERLRADPRVPTGLIRQIEAMRRAQQRLNEESLERAFQPPGGRVRGPRAGIALLLVALEATKGVLEMRALLERGRALAVSRDYALLSWWLTRGARPPFEVIEDGLGFDEARVRSGVDAESQTYAHALEDLHRIIEEGKLDAILQRSPMTERERLRFAAWAFANVLDYEDFHRHFLDIESPLAMVPLGDFPNGEWGAKWIEWTPGEGRTHRRHVFPAGSAMHQVLDQIAQRVERSIEQELGAHWSGRSLRFEDTGAPKRDFRQLRPTRRARFREGTRLALYNHQRERGTDAWADRQKGVLLDRDGIFHPPKGNFWFTEDPHLFVYDDPPAWLDAVPEGFVLVAGADARTHRSIRSSTRYAFEVDEKQSVSGLGPEAARRILTGPAPLGGPWPEAELNAEGRATFIRMWGWRSNRSGLALARIEDLNLDETPPPEPWSAPPAVVCSAGVDLTGLWRHGRDVSWLEQTEGGKVTGRFVQVGSISAGRGLVVGQSSLKGHVVGTRFVGTATGQAQLESNGIRWHEQCPRDFRQELPLELEVDEVKRQMVGRQRWWEIDSWCVVRALDWRPARYVRAEDHAEVEPLMRIVEGW